MACLATPFAGALAPRAVDRADSSPQELLRYFADRPDTPMPRTPAPATWSAAVLALYASAGLTSTAEELATLHAQDAALDPRLQAWVAPLVQAMADATTLSIAGDRVGAAILLLDAVDDARAATTPDPTCLKTADPNDPLNAPAFTVRTSLSAIDDCPSPQRDPLPVPAEAWPATPVADPVGLVEIGSIGPNTYAADRVLLIEPAGDDLWLNNAGGAWKSIVLSTPPRVQGSPVLPVGFAWDMGGNDAYEGILQGAGHLGVGILLEDAGDDTHTCGGICLGAGDAGGIGVFHDQVGNDTYDGGDIAAGAAFGRASIGIFLDDDGADSHKIRGRGQGFAATGDAYFRDIAGPDAYSATVLDQIRGSAFSGRAYFRDFGGSLDAYQYVGINNGSWSSLESTGPLPPSYYAAEGIDS